MRKNATRVLLFCMLISITIAGFSQQRRTVTGVLQDNKGVAVHGASIVEKGTPNGTSSSTDGTFSTSSAYYPRETFNEQMPRRFWLIDPGETNRTNWQAAMTAQGFTPNAQDLPTLSTQRIWYDKNAPAFGAGN